MTAVIAAPALGNRLLDALPAHERDYIHPLLERVALPHRAVLHDLAQPITDVYFPESCVASVITTLRKGDTIEVGTVGSEGIAGLPIFLGDSSGTLRTIVQVPGTAYRVSVGAFAEIAAPTRPLHQLLLRYTSAFLMQVAQTAACNSEHRLEQRCARWLLMTHDHADRDDFPLTHEFLAFMLAVRRPGVTVAMHALRDAGLVQYTRGSVQIIDRSGLEDASCECYDVVRSHYDRLLQAPDIS